MPIEPLTLEQFTSLPTPEDAPYVHAADAAAWWINHATGRAGFVQGGSASWGYTLFSLDDDGRFRISAVAAGHKSKAKATAELHMRMDDPIDA